MRQENNPISHTDQMATRDVSVPRRGAPEALREPKKKGEGISRKTKRLLIGGTAAVLTLTGAGYAAYETIPQVQEAVHRTIGLQDAEVPTTFDSASDTSTFNENNVKKITIQDAQKEGLLKPKMEMVTEDHVKVVLPFPGIFNDFEQIPTIAVSKKLNLREDVDPNTVPVIARQIENLPDEYPLTLPEGFHYTTIADENNPSLINQTIAFYYFPDQDITMSISYGAQGKFTPLSNIQSVSQEEYNNNYNISFGHNYEDLPTTGGVNQISTLSQPDDVLYITMLAFTGKHVVFSRETNKYNYVKLDVTYNTTENKLLTFTTSLN